MSGPTEVKPVGPTLRKRSGATPTLREPHSSLLKVQSVFDHSQFASEVPGSPISAEGNLLRLNIEACDTVVL